MSLGTYALISLDEAKSFLDIKLEKTEFDDLLELLVNSVSAIVETYCDRQLIARDYTTEYHDGMGSDSIITKHWPINSVTSIWDDLDREFTDISLIDSTNYTLYENSGVVTLLGYNFLDGNNDVKISYNAGYSTISYDIKLIVGEIIAKKFKTIRERRLGISNVTSSGEGMTITLDDLPTHKLILDAKYRSRGIS